jgi:ribose transport system ATP-binding protein
MRRENKAVIFISHDLDEMITHCDRLTELRDGVLTAILDKRCHDGGQYQAINVGREMKGDYYRSDFATAVRVKWS